MSIFMVYQDETDGDFKIQKFETGASVRRFLITKHLAYPDFTLIEGTLLKSFDNKTFTMKGKNLCQS